jgi:Fe-S oxidoreductase
VIDLHELWACTNCMYCMENCSSRREHVPKIIDMRRYKVLTEADFSPELHSPAATWKTTPTRGAWAHVRGDWAKELGVKHSAEDPNVEYLFYVGCSGSFDDRGKKISIAFAKILQKPASASSFSERKKAAAAIPRCGAATNIFSRRWPRPIST